MTRREVVPNHLDLDGTVFVYLTTFNGEKWIDQTIQSILNQSYSDLILHISDNASTDGTVGRISDWAKRDSRITFSVQATNRGILFNWMLGLELVKKYPYFMWACQDDFWAHNWLERCVEEIQSRRTSAACGKVVAVDLAGNPLDDYLRQLRRHRYMGSRFRWLRLAGYALDPEEFGKSGRALGVFRTSELLKVALWPKESIDVPQQTWDLLMMRRILAVGQLGTTDSSTLFKRIGSTTVDFSTRTNTEIESMQRRKRIIKFLDGVVADQKSWYHLYASDSFRLHTYERVLIVVKSLRVIRRRIFSAIGAEAKRRQVTM